MANLIIPADVEDPLHQSEGDIRHQAPLVELRTVGGFAKSHVSEVLLATPPPKLLRYSKPRDFRRSRNRKFGKPAKVGAMQQRRNRQRTTMIGQNNAASPGNFARSTMEQERMHGTVVVLVGLTLVDLLIWIFERILDAIDLVPKAVGLAQKLGGCRPHHGEMTIVI